MMISVKERNLIQNTPNSTMCKTSLEKKKLKEIHQHYKSGWIEGEWR